MSDVALLLPRVRSFYQNHCVDYNQMIKSTLLAQLPLNTAKSEQHTFAPPSQQAPTGFINDQQRQIVAQAQQASEAFTLPQNTQASSDIVTEDAATIQDALDALSKQDALGPAITGIPNAEYYTQQQQERPEYFGADPGQYMSDDEAPSPGRPEVKAKLLHDLMTWNGDVKKAIIIGIVFVIVSLTPVDSFVNRYIAMDKIPYSSLILRALIIVVVSFFICSLS